MKQPPEVFGKKKCFPVSFVKFLRTPFSQNTSWRLLLNYSPISECLSEAFKIKESKKQSHKKEKNPLNKQKQKRKQ